MCATRFCVALLATALATPAASQHNDQPLVLRNANLIDGLRDELQSNVTVIVRRGRIISVGSDRFPASATVINLEGRFLLPGLIDMHAHFPRLANAQRALREGVTTARAMGGEYFADVGFRTLHRSGAADVPDVLAVGYQVTRFPFDALFLDAPELRPLYQRDDRLEAYRGVVRLDARRRVDFIKVLASQRAGRPEQDPSQRSLNDEELTSVIMRARRASIPVAVHSHTDDGTRAAVLAGARTIEHGTATSDQTLLLMRERGVCFVPTVASWASNWDGVNDNPVLTARARQMQPVAADTAARAFQLGVTLGAGSDMAYEASDTITLIDEMVALTRTGMSPMDAIRAVTATAAQCLGIERRTGAIRPGLEADLIVVGADPTEDLAALRNPLMIINGGQVAVDRIRNESLAP